MNWGYIILEIITYAFAFLIGISIAKHNWLALTGWVSAWVYATIYCIAYNARCRKR